MFRFKFFPNGRPVQKAHGTAIMEVSKADEIPPLRRLGLRDLGAEMWHVCFWPVFRRHCRLAFTSGLTADF